MRIDERLKKIENSALETPEKLRFAGHGAIFNGIRNRFLQPPTDGGRVRQEHSLPGNGVPPPRRNQKNGRFTIDFEEK